MQWTVFERWIRRTVSPRAGDAAPSALLRTMAVGIMTSRPDEIGCAEVFQRVDVYVETVLSGSRADSLMPLVWDHLHRCQDCREEYEALLSALIAAD